MFVFSSGMILYVMNVTLECSENHFKQPKIDVYSLGTFSFKHHILVLPGATPLPIPRGSLLHRDASRS